MIKEKRTTNTTHRFISKAKGHFKVHIHAPDDTIISRSIGFVRIGKTEALKKAVKLRNEEGQKVWGDHWKKILSDDTVFNRMPKNLEPTYVINKMSDGNIMEIYSAMWSDGEGKRHCRKRSLKKHGRADAYKQTKKILLDAHADIIGLMLFMGRITEKDLKLEFRKNG